VHRANKLAKFGHSLNALHQQYGRQQLSAGGQLPPAAPGKLDHVYFINLAHRTDRLRRTQIEVREMGWTPITTRIDAIKHANGEIGCLRSHVKALRTFLASPHTTALILEDDVCFDYPVKARELLTAFLATHPPDTDWDMLLLSARVWEASPWRPDTPYAIRVHKAVLCTAYMVTRAAAARLIEIWETTEGREPCDTSWFELMRTSRTLALQPLIASQFKSFSDIKQRLVPSKRM
jgi:GR25 family glycosyltransferase involved in LPS biosynthesis